MHHDADERVVQVSGDGSEVQVLPNLSCGTVSSGPAGADPANRLPPVQEGQNALLDARIRLSFHVKLSMPREGERVSDCSEGVELLRTSSDSSGDVPWVFVVEHAVGRQAGSLTSRR